MKIYIARYPIFNRGMEVFGYKLHLCRSLKDHYYAMYSEPDDAEGLYGLLCFAPSGGPTARPAAFIEYSDELLERLVPLLPREHVVIEYDSNDNSERTDVKNLLRIKTQGYQVAFDASVNSARKLIELSDIARIDVSAVSMEVQQALIARNRGKIKFLACGVETWEDFKKAFSIGYEYFQGRFFMKPFAEKAGGIRSFNANLLCIIAALGEDEPSFREITNIIEHDVNLSYKLLKLVSSAYVAPKFKVKTISQAVTIVGTSELSKLIATILINETRSPGNMELLRRSLIRGKFMELLADNKNIMQKGSEAFFTGIFSLIDVILNRDMQDIMEELPLTDDVKEALTGGTNSLKTLLDLVADYEKAEWESFNTFYKPDLIEQKYLMDFYITALIWAESLDI